MNRSRTAGERLRADLDAALERRAIEHGEKLVWDERDLANITAAIHAADTAERLDKLLDDELTGLKRAGVVAKLAAEGRMQRKAVAEHVGRLGLGWAAPPKSQHHVEAGRRAVASPRDREVGDRPRMRRARWVRRRLELFDAGAVTSDLGAAGDRQRGGRVAD